MYHIVFIDSCDDKLQDGSIEEVSVKNDKEAWEQAKIFIGRDQVLTTFWGTWDKQRVLFLCNDNGMALNLLPNKPATLAYLDQCYPGTMHVILGPCVALLQKELW